MPAAVPQALYLAVLLGHRLAALKSGQDAFWPEHFSAAPVPILRDAFLVAEQPHTLSGLAAFGIVPGRPCSNSKDVREYVQVMEHLHTHLAA